MEATLPFNGSNGTFNRIYSFVVDAANNINISSSRMDAELNGIAAGLSDCITRDGQSPPSADLPMGGKKLTNLGNATTSTDALNMATGDARYILANVTSLSLSGSITAGTSLNSATLAVSGNGTVGGTLTVGSLMTGNAFQANGQTTNWNVGYSHSKAGFVGYHLYNQGAVAEWLVYQSAHGTDDNLHIATGVAGSLTDRLIITPAGSVTIPGAVSLSSTLNVAGAATLAALTASGLITGNAGFSGTTLTLSSTLNVTGQTSLGNVTGTPNGTAVNGLGFAGAPSTVKTANYQLAASDIGQDIAFNGTTLTCTIPAGLPNGFVAIIANINASALTITSASDVLTWSGTTSTGNRTLGQNGEARIIRRNGVFYIGGTALS